MTMDKNVFHLKKRIKYAGDVHARLLDAGWDLDTAALFVDGIPDADAEEVVRCKECQFVKRHGREGGIVGYYCGHPKNKFAYGRSGNCVFFPPKKANDFCSYGERRDGND